MDDEMGKTKREQLRARKVAILQGREQEKAIIPLGRPQTHRRSIKCEAATLTEGHLVPKCYLPEPALVL